MNMRGKKISVSGLLCLTSVLVGFAVIGKAATPAPAPWKQTEFMIGAYDSVRMSGDASKDKKSLETMINAGFNLIVKQEPYTSSFHLTGEEYEGRKVTSIKYCLERVADINKTYGANKLKMIVNDYRFFVSSHQGQDLVGSDFDGYKALSKDLRNSLYGYHLQDEPLTDNCPTTSSEAKVVRVSEVIKPLKSAMKNDPEKLAYINLGAGGYGASIPENADDYRSYVRTLAQNASLFSFDTYNWNSPNGLPNNEIARPYFQMCQIMAEEAKSANKPWWGIAPSVLHGERDNNSNWLNGTVFYHPSDYNKSVAMTQFGAYSYLIYGAKGISWYTYDTYNNPISNPTHEPLHKDVTTSPNSSLYYYDGCLDWAGNTTGIYDIVKSVNSVLKKMGPTLMDLKWLSTIHGSSNNNYGDIPEGSLPTINANTPVLSSVSSTATDTLAVGIFEGKDNNNYLMVLNKDVDNMKGYNLGLKNSMLAYKFNKTTGSFESYTYGNNLHVEVEPGDIELIKLVKLSPNLTAGKNTTANDYLINEAPDKAIDGNTNNTWEKWCSRLGAGSYLIVDLGEERLIGSYMVVHANGSYAECYENYCTRSFRIQGSSDLNNWYDVDVVANNNERVTFKSVYPFRTRYLRLYIDSPDLDNVTRIYEFQAFSTKSENGPEVFQHSNYQGYKAILPDGRLTLADLRSMGVYDNDITGIKVPQGYEVVIYSDDNFRGYSYVLDRDCNTLVDIRMLNGRNWNDQISSIVVRRK